MRETVEGDLLPACAGLAVVAVRSDRDTAARRKFAPDLNVLRSIRRMRSFIMMFTQSSWKSPWLRKLNRYSLSDLLSTMRSPAHKRYR